MSCTLENRLLPADTAAETSCIGLVAPTDIYAYTWGSGTKALWTPLMLRFENVFYDDYEEALTPEAKQEILERIPVDPDGVSFVEFLYLNGDDRGWNWGRNGMTNAAFLHDAARAYFRQFF